MSCQLWPPMCVSLFNVFHFHSWIPSRSQFILFRIMKWHVCVILNCSEFYGSPSYFCPSGAEVETQQLVLELLHQLALLGISSPLPDINKHRIAASLEKEQQQQMSIHNLLLPLDPCFIVPCTRHFPLAKSVLLLLLSNSNRSRQKTLSSRVTNSFSPTYLPIHGCVSAGIKWSG